MNKLAKSLLTVIGCFIVVCLAIVVLAYNLAYFSAYANKPHKYYYLGDHIGLVSLVDRTKIFVDTRDNMIAMVLIESGSWEDRDINLVTSMLKPNDRVIEVGANYGTYLVRIANKLRNLDPQKNLAADQLYAFEANPRIFYLLNRTLGLNGINVNLFNSPVFSLSNKEISFIVEDINAGHGRILDKKQAQSGGEQDLTRVFFAKTVALDDLLKDNLKFDLLRMDAEGSELEILKGAKQIIANSPDVIIYAEWFPEMMSAHSDVAKELQYYLDSGFNFYKVKEGKLHAVSKSELLDPKDFQNVVFSRKKLL